MSCINCKGKLVDLSVPKVMGILNKTPDSFYDGGKFKNETNVLRHVEKMLKDGATFIDVGGISTRPKAELIDEEEELKRVIPAIALLIQKFPEILISIDTFRSKVALEAVQNGACMINDISGGEMDSNMFTTVAQLKVPYVLTHIQGTPQTMQEGIVYDNVVNDIIYYFSKKLVELRTLGLYDLIIDVGFGFGKTLEQNYALLNNLDLFKNLEVPILSGISRKSMLYKLLHTTPDMALNATTAANTIALLKGTNILRVHDVKEANEAIKIINALE